MTIKDLSEQTGYSVGTISRVLNHQPNVSEKARRIIMDRVNETGFQLNSNAKQLKQRYATSILVIVKGTSNELFAALMEQLQELISQTEYPLLTDYIDEDTNEVQRAVQLCRERKPRGILFLGGNSANFRKGFKEISVPCVLVTNDASELKFPNLSSVTVDDRQAACCAIRHLIELGHRDFAVIGGNCQLSDTSRYRYEGCLQAFQENNIPFDPERDYQGVRYSYQDGYDAAKRLLSSGQKITALFAVADVMAIGAIRALRDSGLRVPEDVSVMGFDGLTIGSFFVPMISTIVQPLQKIAQRSVEILLDGMEKGKEAQYVTVPFVIQPRESTRNISGGEL